MKKFIMAIMLMVVAAISAFSETRIELIKDTLSRYGGFHIVDRDADLWYQPSKDIYIQYYIDNTAESQNNVNELILKEYKNDPDIEVIDDIDWLDQPAMGRLFHIKNVETGIELYIWISSDEGEGYVTAFMSNLSKFKWLWSNLPR